MPNLLYMYNGTLDFNFTSSTNATTTDDVLSPHQHVIVILKRQYEDYLLLALNIAALIIFLLDKSRARQGGWRVREAFLYVCCLNAPIASFLGMLIAWHKVRKIIFYLAVLVGLFLMYQSYGFIVDAGLSWWKVVGCINVALTFLTLVCEC
ncbi:hypothetical protein HA402_005022 [Bradysia odoriphaga]|nr:hypothetical protein HA402_005022 [Bradysia odoriphaga]